MDALELLKLHLALEGVGINEAGELVRIPCPDPDTLHRVYVVRHAGGDCIFFRAGLPHHVRSRLRGLAISDFFTSPERVTSILEEDGPCAEIHIGRSYVFPEGIGPADYPDVVRLSELDAEMVRRYDADLVGCPIPVFCVVVEGEIVSTCLSSRENDHAGEAWVRTLPAYRRRGYARQVTAAWGRALQEQGKTPFYSHREDNPGSLAVARALGLLEYMRDAGYG